MRNLPKHSSCDPELIRMADTQAEKEGAGWNNCYQCDIHGVWWKEDRSNSTGWTSYLCSDCEGYGWTYYLEGARPPKQSVPMMAERYQLKVGW